MAGPFSRKEMHDWFLGGFFPPTLPVRREGEEEFKPLSSYGEKPFAPQHRKKPQPSSGKEKGDLRSNRNQNWRDSGERGTADQEHEKGNPKKESSLSRAKGSVDKPTEGNNHSLNAKPSENQSVNITDYSTQIEATSKDEKTPVEKKVDEMIKAAKQVKRKAESESEGETAHPQPQQQLPSGAVAKLTTGGTTTTGAAVDLSDTESMDDDILDHFPRLGADFVASSDDEPEEKPLFAAEGVRPAPLGGWTAAKVLIPPHHTDTYF